MSTVAPVLSNEPGAVRPYVTNVSLAIRSLIQALFAIKPYHSDNTAVASDENISPRTRAESIWTLYRMANQYDSVMPTLSNELRLFASRD